MHSEVEVDFEPLDVSVSGVAVADGAPLEPIPGLVGRERELDRLTAALQRASEGVGQTVMVVGADGIGKSALLDTFEVLASAAGATVVRVSGDEDEADIPFGVIEQVMQRLGVGWEGGGGAPAVVGANVVTACRADNALVVLMVDDVHWGDGSSLLALAFAVRRLGDSRVLAVLTCREGAEAGLPAGLVKVAGGDSGATLRLAGLGFEALDALLRPVWGRLPPAQLARVHDHTNGHPMHALALARDLDRRLLDSDPTTPLPSPLSISTLVLARLAASPSGVEALVVAASVLGMTCSTDDAVELSGIEDVERAVEGAIAGEFLERDGWAGLRFRHSMTRSAVYYDIGRDRAAQLHRRAAALCPGREGLRHRLRGAPHADVALAAEAEALAESLARSGSWYEAAGWLEEAVNVSATHRAAERRRWTAVMYRIYGGDTMPTSPEGGLDVGGEHPVRLLLEGTAAAGESRYGDAEVFLRAAWEGIDPAAEFDIAARIALRLADCMQGQLRIKQALKWARLAVELLPPGYDLLGEDPLADLGLALLGTGYVSEAIALVEERVPVVDIATPGLFGRGIVELFTDRPAAAVRSLSKVADRYSRLGPPHRHVMAQFLLAEAEFRLGLWDYSSRHAQEAIVAARVRAIPQLTALALSMSAGVTAARGDWPAAEAALRESQEALSQRGSYEALGWTWIAQSRVESARGNFQGVIDTFSTLASVSDALPLADDQALVPWRGPYALALFRMGRIAEASQQSERLSDFASVSQARSVLGAAARLRGVLASARGDVESAAAELSDAIAQFETIPMPFEAAQSQLDLGCELRRAGRRREAASHLEAARTVFARLGASPFVQRCDSELASCGLRANHRLRDASSESLTSLTAAESAVAELVAEGATNRQAADTLSVSVRTVEHHLRRAYTKLGVTSRSQLAARFRNLSAKDP